MTASLSAVADQQPAQHPHYVSYVFLRVPADWRRQHPGERLRDKAEWVAAIEHAAQTMFVRTYSTVGTRADCDLLVRCAARRLQDVHGLHVLLNQTGLMRWAERTHSLLGVTRRSPYADQPTPLAPRPDGGSAWLVVYPMWKRRDWYRLPEDERGQIMRDHIALARRHGAIDTNTAYSFGIDDHEFVVAFDVPEPSGFVDLVQHLRTTESAAFTSSETPIFTCLAGSPERVLDALDGGSP